MDNYVPTSLASETHLNPIKYSKEISNKKTKHARVGNWISISMAVSSFPNLMMMNHEAPNSCGTRNWEFFCMA